jgi:hypothetical protein
MVISDEAAVELYEELADDLWRRTHKGTNAVERLQTVLDRSGIKRGKRTRPIRSRLKAPRRSARR